MTPANTSPTPGTPGSPFLAPPAGVTTVSWVTPGLRSAARLWQPVGQSPRLPVLLAAVARAARVGDWDTGAAWVGRAGDLLPDWGAYRQAFFVGALLLFPLAAGRPERARVLRHWLNAARGADAQHDAAVCVALALLSATTGQTWQALGELEEAGRLLPAEHPARAALAEMWTMTG